VAMRPSWERAVNSRKNVNVLEVNASASKKLISSHPDFFDQLTVHGFPTIYFKTRNGVSLFTMPRTTENIVDFIDRNVETTGGGKKTMNGLYQRGPKKGKLKKGFRFVDGKPHKS